MGSRSELAFVQPVGLQRGCGGRVLLCGRGHLSGGGLLAVFSAMPRALMTIKQSQRGKQRN